MIKITITENSNDNDALNYLISQLNISEESIGKLGFYKNIAGILFELTEDDIKDCLFGEDQIKQEEYESLIKFIKLRDEMKESNKINKNSSKEEISKFIKNKLNFDIDKQDIKDLNLKIYENLTNDEKEIIQKFIDEIKRKKKYIITDSKDIYYSKKKKNFSKKMQNIMFF